MSGPLSVLSDQIHRLTRARAEARAKAHLGRLAAGLSFSGLAHRPPVRDFGDFTAARDALSGTLRIGGYATPLTDLTPWDIPLPTEALTQALHGFAWLDDFEALSGKAARAQAQRWAIGWLDRFGEGQGPGWTPVATAGRLKRMIIHMPFLEKDLEGEQLSRLQAILPVFAAFLDETSGRAETGADRAAALTGMVYGAICLNGWQDRLAPALKGLAQLAQDRVSPNGGMKSRNPEALLAVFRDLVTVKTLLEETTRPPVPEIEAAIRRIAPALRLLRHGDGTLARFHGGGPGADGLLDRSLAEAGIRTRPGTAPAMGYVRLHGGRTQVIVDCARPPENSDHGHASTLAFEMSSGRRPVIVNTGPALAQCPDWWRAARSTSAHNTLALDKTSSSRLGPERAAGRAGFDALLTRPSMVTLAQASDATGAWIQTRHDGYLEDYGLLHERRLFLSAQGDQVHGEDVLLSPDDKARRRFSARIKGASKLGVALSVHFHLHPDVDAALERATDTVRLTLLSGEVWVFRHDGGQVDLETGVYLDPDKPEPVATRQMVLRSRATTHKAEISWSLVREVVAGRARRDVAVDAQQG
ncbi:heparinase II/III family protein [Oceanibium sediminis]|uniref:heparinase II/III family protein n=1 Tax=Oceanibium sediminis TaxID=2026339 RepID=UPI000DD3B481|nr:heparinase II/III family protein [Oceanibium sediminis]